MSDTIKDGGPAFPRPAAEHSFGGCMEQDGMTLRDWFAGMAVKGSYFGSTNEFSQQKFDGYAVNAYRLADAMLKAREGGAS